jgi:hypothetical protein
VPTLGISLLQSLADDLHAATIIDLTPPPPPPWYPQHRKDCDHGDRCACPQIRAYESEADQIGYGGAAGGGKSDLLLGFAGTKHKKSIIFRRVFPSLRGMIERSREIFNATDRPHAKDSYNEGLHVWRMSDGRMLEFASVQLPAHLKKYQGQPHDFIGIDEATEFPEFYVRFLTGWNRTSDPTQPCRVLLTFNPPMDDSGSWIVGYFAPWLDEDYPDRARDGEIRYVARIDNKDIFYRSSDEVSEEHIAFLEEQARDQDFDDWREVLKKRTFFHASLRDNPILAATGYGSTIEAMPEPLRSFLKGNFNAGQVVDPWQVIPRAWVKAAQARWTPERPATGLRSVGCDVARGGDDQTALAEFVGNWLAPLLRYPGKATPDGPSVAALLLGYIQSKIRIAIDVIGIGSSAYDTAKSNGAKIMPVNNGAGAPDGATDRSKTMKFRNVRAAAYWKFREALDPEHGENLALPPDPELVADLCSAKYSLSAGGILIEPKEDIKERIGRSPDSADAVVLAHYGIWAAPKPPPTAIPGGATRESPWK